MKIELLENCYVDGEPCKKGQEVDTSNANLLIGMGKAKLAAEKKPKVKKADVSTDQ